MVEKVFDYYENNSIKTESYIKEDKLHNEDGPAYIYYNWNGVKNHEVYYIDGVLHREDGPAAIWFSESGDVIYEEYFINGVLHREGGPARTIISDDGSKTEVYFSGGKRHREDGAAVIGKDVLEYWYDGNKLSVKTDIGLKRYIKKSIKA